MSSSLDLPQLISEIRACRICVEQPRTRPLPHDPRPVLQLSAKAQLCISGQAPGARVHKSGRPFTDPSGERLRDWMQVNEQTFYDADKVAIVPMGFCFPGNDEKGGDLPPRSECKAAWHDQLYAGRQPFGLILAVGQYAIRYHLPQCRRQSLTETVRQFACRSSADLAGQVILPLPHPSWRNTAWMKKNPWFEQDYLPVIRRRIVEVIGKN